MARALRPARRRQAYPPPVARSREGVGLRALRHGGDDRAPVIGIGADGDVERRFAEERNAELLGFRARPSVRKDIRSPAAVRTNEVAHILDDADERHFHLIEHRDAPPGVDQRQILRRRNDHRAGERHVLGHGQLRVAGAGRHVGDEHVEFAPRDLAQELVQGRDHHGTAPDHRRALLDQEADRHHLHAEAFERDELLAVRRQARFGLDAEQPRHRGSEQVGVENADLKPELRKANGEVAGHSRFAHSALAGGDRDDVLDARQRLARPAMPARRASP